MTTRSGPAVLLCAILLVAVGGCASDGGGGGDGGPDPNDKRAVALACIRDDQDLPARLSGEKSIQVDGAGGARVEFTVSSGEAEGRQFQGEAQDAEQIGAALLFINGASEEQLKKIETCLEAQ